MLQHRQDALNKSNPDPTATKKAKAAEKPARVEPKRFAVYDPQPLLGESLACWLRSMNSRCVVANFQKIDALLNSVGSEQQVGLIVFSIGEVGFPQVFEALDKLASMPLSIPAVVISGREDPGAALEFLRRGARGFIPTSLDLMGAWAALDFVAAGGTFLPAPLFLDAGLAASRRRPAGGVSIVNFAKEQNGEARSGVGLPRTAVPLETAELTSREAKVLQCLCRGKPNKLIAHELALCESTVKMYVGRLMRKLRATNRTEAALFGERLLRELTASKPERPETADQVIYGVQPLRLGESVPRQQLCESTSID